MSVGAVSRELIHQVNSERANQFEQSTLVISSHWPGAAICQQLVGVLSGYHLSPVCRSSGSRNENLDQRFFHLVASLTTPSPGRIHGAPCCGSSTISRCDLKVRWRKIGQVVSKSFTFSIRVIASVVSSFAENFPRQCRCAEPRPSRFPTPLPSLGTNVSLVGGWKRQAGGLLRVLGGGAGGALVIRFPERLEQHQLLVAPTHPLVPLFEG